jgi:hypothetical protein
MRLNKILAVTGVIVLLTLGGTLKTLFPVAAQALVPGTEAPTVAVGPQYDSTHVYVAPADFDRFVASLLATFRLQCPIHSARSERAIWWRTWMPLSELRAPQVRTSLSRCLKMQSAVMRLSSGPAG